MTELSNLREKVEQTAGLLSAAQADRERRTGDLLAMLNKLEGKFTVQQEQLEHYRTRIGPLEQSYKELSELMESLLAMIDSDVVTGEADPLRRATDVAARLLAEDMAVAPEAAQPDDATKTDETEEPVESRFEDVSAQELEAELAAEAAEVEAELPEAAIEAEAEALAVSIGSSGAEISAEIGAGEADAAQIVAEEMAAADVPPELEAEAEAEPVMEAEPEAEPEAVAEEEAEALTAELDIPEPEPEAVIEAEAESAVASAIEDTINSVASVEEAVAEGEASDKLDIRQLLKRVEKAARAAQALSQAHAAKENGGEQASTETAETGENERDEKVA